MTSDTLVSIVTGEAAEPAGDAGLCNIMVHPLAWLMRPKRVDSPPRDVDRDSSISWHTPCIQLICFCGRAPDMQVVSGTAPRKAKRRVGSGEHFSSFTMKPRLDKVSAYKGRSRSMCPSYGESREDRKLFP